MAKNTKKVPENKIILIKQVQKREGKIVSFEAGSVTIEDATAGRNVTIALNKMARARLEPEI